MGIPCSEMLRLAGAERLELVGGAAGLDREIMWVHLGDSVGSTRELGEFLNGHELVLITGRGLDGGAEELVPMLKLLKDREAAGLVVNIGPYIPEIPPQAAALADELALPLFSLPWKYKLVDVTRMVCNAIISSEQSARKSASLLEEILFGTSPGEELAELLAGVGLEGGEEFAVGVIGAEIFGEAGDTQTALSRRRKLYSTAAAAFAESGVDAVFLQRGSGSLVFLCADQINLAAKLGEIARAVDAKLRKSHGCGVRMGLGRGYGSSAGLRRSYSQARQAVKCAPMGGLSSYSELGIDTLLLDIRDRDRMEELYRDTMRPILAYDRTGGSNLYETLDTYYNCNMDAALAAETMFLHKNTVRYRIGKIEELLGASLKDVQTVMLLGVCLKIGRLLNSEDI